MPSAVPINGNLVGATAPAPELQKVYYYHRYARRHDTVERTAVATVAITVAITPATTVATTRATTGGYYRRY